MIDGPPKVVPLTVDLHEHLVQMPAPPAGFHARNPALSDLGREHRAEPMPPVSHRFMADIDAAFVQQIFDIAKGQRETDVQHHRQADNLTARFEIAKWIRFGHPVRLRNRPARLKRFCSDSASDHDHSPLPWAGMRLRTVSASRQVFSHRTFIISLQRFASAGAVSEQS